MTFSDRDHQDSKVLLVGFICAMVIFTVITSYETLSVAQVVYVDLVPSR